MVDEAFGGELITQGECLKGKKKKPMGGILMKSIFKVIYRKKESMKEI